MLLTFWPQLKNAVIHRFGPYQLFKRKFLHFCGYDFLSFFIDLYQNAQPVIVTNVSQITCKIV